MTSRSSGKVPNKFPGLPGENYVLTLGLKHNSQFCHFKPFRRQTTFDLVLVLDHNVSLSGSAGYHRGYQS